MKGSPGLFFFVFSGKRFRPGSALIGQLTRFFWRRRYDPTRRVVFLFLSNLPASMAYFRSPLLVQ